MSAMPFDVVGLTFTELQAIEVDRARAKHEHNIVSRHEAYAVIKEELDEFWDLVRLQNPSNPDLLTELLHVAAMCQRAAEDLGLANNLNLFAQWQQKMVAVAGRCPICGELPTMVESEIGQLTKTTYFHLVCNSTHRWGSYNSNIVAFDSRWRP